MNKKNDRSKVKSMACILIQRINGTEPEHQMEECDTDRAWVIVDEHRDALGIGSYDTIEDHWLEYAQEREKAKLQKAKIQKPQTKTSY